MCKITMGKWKYSQNEEKTEDKPDKQREEAPTKGKDDAKEGDTIY